MPKLFFKKRNIFKKINNNNFFKEKINFKALSSYSTFFKKEKIKKSKVFWKVKNGHFKMSKNDFPKKVLENRILFFKLL
jgi:hypothetical protein